MLPRRAWVEQSMKKRVLVSSWNISLYPIKSEATLRPSSKGSVIAREKNERAMRDFRQRSWRTHGHKWRVGTHQNPPFRPRSARPQSSPLSSLIIWDFSERVSIRLSIDLQFRIEQGSTLHTISPVAAQFTLFVSLKCHFFYRFNGLNTTKITLLTIFSIKMIYVVYIFINVENSSSKKSQK